MFKKICIILCMGMIVSSVQASQDALLDDNLNRDSVAFFQQCIETQDAEDNPIRNIFATHESAPENWIDSYNNFMKSYIQPEQFNSLYAIGDSEMFLTTLSRGMGPYYRCLQEIRTMEGDKEEFSYTDDPSLYFLPPEIGEYTELTDLILEKNHLLAIPKEIGNLENIEYINLSYNFLKTLPQEIGDLWCLSDLDLCYNKIEKIPEWENLHDIETLDLTGNPISLT